MTYVLHRSALFGWEDSYIVGDTPLVIVRSLWGRGWTLWLSDATRPVVRAWAVRNHSLVDASFPTRHQALQTVTAVLAVDPLPEYEILPLSRLRPDGKDGFVVTETDLIGHVQILRARYGGWKVRIRPSQDAAEWGDDLPAFSLWEARKAVAAQMGASLAGE